VKGEGRRSGSHRGGRGGGLVNEEGGVDGIAVSSQPHSSHIDSCTKERVIIHVTSITFCNRVCDAT